MDQVRLLFLGESPPASGRLFSNRDSGLYRAMLDAFTRAQPDLQEDSFLAVFEASGCRLVDLCPHPVDRLTPRQRRAACGESEQLLAGTIRRLQPQRIATLLRSIEGNVARAIAAAGWEGPVLHLPYPGRWAHLRMRFTQLLIPVISPLLAIPDQPFSEADWPTPSTPPALARAVRR